MNELTPFDLPSFLDRARQNKNSFRRFLTKLEKDPPPRMAAITSQLETEVWGETDCLSCANCCKTMSPTFSNKDIKRISAHLGHTPDEFKAKYLVREKGGDRDWLNKSEPCQFLDTIDNKCSIYEVRPSDCAGFPHLPKKMQGYAHVHKQNIEFCPATYRLVEKMKERLKASS